MRRTKFRGSKLLPRMRIRIGKDRSCTVRGESKFTRARQRSIFKYLERGRFPLCKGRSGRSKRFGDVFFRIDLLSGHRQETIRPGAIFRRHSFSCHHDHRNGRGLAVRKGELHQAAVKGGGNLIRSGQDRQFWKVDKSAIA